MEEAQQHTQKEPCFNLRLLQIMDCPLQQHKQQLTGGASSRQDSMASQPDLLEL